MGDKEPEPLFNRVLLEFEFPEDKFMGHEQWMADAELVIALARRLFYPERRGKLTTSKWDEPRDDD